MNSIWTRWPVSSVFVFRGYPSARLRTRIFKALFVPNLQLARMSADTRKRKLVAGEIVSSKRKVQSATTKAEVVNFFKPSSEREPEKITWRLVAKTLLVGRYLNKAEAGEAGEGSSGTPVQLNSKKIAGFDLDSTLIITKSGQKFANSPKDWQWWHSSVPAKLQELHRKGYHLILFTNQGGITDPTKNSIRLVTFKSKLAAILTTLDIPGVTVYAATGNDRYRKPRPGMWEECLGDLGLDAEGVDLGGSYLVGDAAGREGDFSDTDRNWALNIGLGFNTPEGFFLGKKPAAMSHKFDPSNYITTAGTTATAAKTSIGFTKSTAGKEVVLFVGSPGAGKSTFYRRYLEPLGYERINQDMLKTKPKCFVVGQKLLSQGKSIAVDNSNPDLATRAGWITVAKQHNAPIRCVYFTSPEELCIHNAAVRAFGGDIVNPEMRNMLPGIAFRTYKSRFKKPKMNEGYSDLVEVDFLWEGEEEEKKIWEKFWT